MEAAFVDPYESEILYYRSYMAPGSSGLPISAAEIQKMFGDTYYSGYFWAGDCTVVMDSTHLQIDPMPSPNDATPGFWQMVSGGIKGEPKGRPVMGGDSFLVISAGPDRKYFTNDDLVMAK
jgi:hypothetical protein